MLSHTLLKIDMLTHTTEMLSHTHMKNCTLTHTQLKCSHTHISEPVMTQLYSYLVFSCLSSPYHTFSSPALSLSRSFSLSLSLSVCLSACLPVCLCLAVVLFSAGVLLMPLWSCRHSCGFLSPDLSSRGWAGEAPTSLSLSQIVR